MYFTILYTTHTAAPTQLKGFICNLNLIGFSHSHGRLWLQCNLFSILFKRYLLNVTYVLRSYTRDTVANKKNIVNLLEFTVQLEDRDIEQSIISLMSRTRKEIHNVYQGNISLSWASGGKPTRLKMYYLKEGW